MKVNWNVIQHQTTIEKIRKKNYNNAMGFNIYNYQTSV